MTLNVAGVLQQVLLWLPISRSDTGLLVRLVRGTALGAEPAHRDHAPRFAVITC